MWLNFLSVNKLIAEYAGKPLAIETRKIYSRLEDARFPEVKDGCFMAGTLVWTDKGLVPIEQIKVGDMVLSQPEQGGERAYKRVKQTFVHEDKQVMLVRLLNASDTPEIVGEATELNLVVTPNHPFWTVGQGWIPANRLAPGDEEHLLQLHDGEIGFIWHSEAISQTPTPDVGCVYERSRGYTYRLDARAGYLRWIFDDAQYSGALFENYQDGNFRTRVYNLEVEDFHTYYVGKLGVWVHNRSSGQNVSTVPSIFQVELRNTGQVVATPEFPRLLAAEIDARFPQPSNGGFVIIDRGARSGAGENFDSGVIGKLKVVGEPQRPSGEIISNAECAMVMRNADRAGSLEVKSLIAKNLSIFPWAWASVSAMQLRRKPLQHSAMP